MARSIERLCAGERLDDDTASFFARALRKLHALDTGGAGAGLGADAVRSEDDLRAAVRDMSHALLARGAPRAALIDALAHELATQQTMDASRCAQDATAALAATEIDTEEDFIVKGPARRYARLSTTGATRALERGADHFNASPGELEVWTLIYYEARYGLPYNLERI